MSLKVTQLTGFNKAKPIEVAAGVTLYYLGFSTSYTPSFVAPEAGTMVVTVGARATATREVSSITIAGNEALRVTTTGAVAASGLASYNVSAGSNAVSITYSASVSYEGVHAWLVTGLSSAVPTATASGDGGNSINMNFTIPANGLAIYHGMIRTSTSAAWSSATEQSEDTGNKSSTHSAAYITTETVLTGHTETVTFGSSVNSAACCAAFSAA